MKNIDTKFLQDLLQSTTNKIDATNNSTEINTMIENLVLSLMDTDYSSIWLYDKNNSALSRNRDSSHLQSVSLSEKRGVLYKCFMTLQPQIYNHLASEKEYVSQIDNPDNIQIKSTILLPLIDEGNFIGIIAAYSSVKKIKNFQKNDLELLKSIAGFTVNSIYKMKPSLKEIENQGERKEHLKKSEHTAIHVASQKENLKNKNNRSDKSLVLVANSMCDIKVPISTLTSFLDLLEDHILDPRLKYYILAAKESAEGISNLASLTLEKISSKNVIEELKVESVNAGKFFSDIADMFSSNMYAKKIDYTIFIDPHLPKEIKIEPLKLKRVIMNLINNSLRFTPLNGSIEFSAIYKQNDRKIAVLVKDTGVGMDKENQEKILNFFEKVEENKFFDYAEGCSLAVFASDVKDLGGVLKFSSELNKGSEFSFDVPTKSSDYVPLFNQIDNEDVKVYMLVKGQNITVANNILRYLKSMGLNKNQIVVKSSMPAEQENITHLISFQHKTNAEIIDNIIMKGVKHIIIEEDLFSLCDDSIYSRRNIVSQYACFANELYAFISKKNKPKVLIADDNIIASIIGKTLENQCCEIHVANNAEEALALFMNAKISANAFTLVYMDGYMRAADGQKAIKKLRNYEKENRLEPIYAVSISDDKMVDKEYFDICIIKPFRTEDILQTLNLVN